MVSLVIGMGEIGKAVKAVIGASYIRDVTTEVNIPNKVDILHICFPYSEEFSHEVARYCAIYKPDHLIIYSTVPIGTTGQFGDWAVHSPVEGKHPDLEMSIRSMERWVGYNHVDAKFFFANYFRDLGLRVKMVSSTAHTEALKLLSTSEYGINIAFADYKAKVADAVGMDYKLTKEWNEEYNKLYRNLGLDKRFQKFVLDPPKGRIGGHCVVPNAKILSEQYPSVLLNVIKEMT